MTVIDSSSWIEALRQSGSPVVKARVAALLERGEAAWCAMIRLELWRGARAGDERKAILYLEQRIDDLEINATIWTNALELMRKARSKGLTAPSQDVLIVSTARYHGALIEHHDKHLADLVELA